MIENIQVKNYRFHDLSTVEVYNMVLRGDVIKKFPKGFWKGEEGISNAKEIIKYLFEEKLKWNDDKVRANLSAKVFRENCLCGMLSNMFGDSPFDAYNLAYPDKFKPWEFGQAPLKFWSKETGIVATKWLIEEKLQWNDEEILSNLTYKTFSENGLRGMLQHVYSHSPFEAINHAYPGKYKPWEFRQTPKRFWNRENAFEAITWLIEEKLKWNAEDIRKNLTADTFRGNNLHGMLNYVFKNSPFDAINLVYPNKFKPWEFRKTPLNFWNKDTAVTATRWMVEEKLKLSTENLDNINRSHFEKYGLNGMLVVVFKGNYRAALEAAYPAVASIGEDGN